MNFKEEKYVIVCKNSLENYSQTLLHGGQKFIQGKISLEELEMEIKQVLKSE